MQPEVAEYHRRADALLRHPPDPRFSVLAVAWYQKALILEPGCLETYLGLARAHHQLGQTDQSLHCCDKAIELQPGSLVGHFYDCMLQIPIIYQSTEEMKSARRRYQQKLYALRDRVENAAPEALQALAPEVGRVSPFYLSYQDRNDLELQEVYGRLIHLVMTATYAPEPRALQTAERPIRVGIVSAHFHQHSIWKVLLSGWLEQLNRERFQLYGYSLGERESEAARPSFFKFSRGPASVEQWIQRITSDRPHLLIYPEVSMNRRAIQLSALRLAPVQGTTWGSYVTSGLPTMDFFLSGQLLEPVDAREHYSERLVPLPGLSTFWRPPQVVPAKRERPSFGLRTSAVVYFCAQSLFKYLPAYDEIYPRIAAEVGDCQFVFLKHKTSEGLTQLFFRRLQSAFAQAGIDAENYLVLQPALTDAEYHRLNELSDIFLDSIGVGGTTTTLESIHHNLPVVTLPGEFLRGRVSSGILESMGVTRTIASNVDHYVELAVRLAVDIDWRKDVTRQMKERKHQVYQDQACIQGLESFLGESW